MIVVEQSLWPNGVEEPHNIPLSVLRYLMARHNGQELDARDSFPYVVSEEHGQMANVGSGPWSMGSDALHGWRSNVRG